MIGLVYYADDPHKRVFRQVFLAPGEDEAVLDDPKWVTEGVDPDRRAVLVKVAPEEVALYPAGTPGTPADAPLSTGMVQYVSPPELVEAVMDLAKVGPDDVLVDVGSGYGPYLAAAIARGARAIGIESNAAANVVARELAPGAEIREQDWTGADLGAATVVVFFPYAFDPTPALALPEGARLVTVDRDMPGLGAPEKIEAAGFAVRMWRL